MDGTGTMNMMMMLTIKKMAETVGVTHDGGKGSYILVVVVVVVVVVFVFDW